jgi:two-component system response regulator
LNEKFILLVEDNPDEEVLALHALHKNNIRDRVVVVHDGAEALDFLFAQGAHAGRDGRERPHVVLLDLNLPKVDGLDVLRRLRAHEQTKLLPIVVLTSSREQRDIVEAYRLGANSYIYKPVDFAQFTAAVQHLGLYWLVINEPLPTS